MKREEAIQQLQNCKDLIKQDGQDYLDERDVPILDMAIEALRNCSEKPNGSLISKEDAIEAMDKLWGDIKRTHRRVAKGHEAVYLDMRGTIKTLPPADRPTGWIPVSEKLPDLKTEVIYSFDGIVSTGYMIDRDFNGEKTESHWEDLESGVTIEPTHWMPLPEPYKGGDTDW